MSRQPQLTSWNAELSAHFPVFRAIVRLGWHPLMRVKKGGTFRPARWGGFHPLAKLLPDIGGTFRAEGRAYATEKLPRTLLARFGRRRIPGPAKRSPVRGVGG